MNKKVFVIASCAVLAIVLVAVTVRLVAVKGRRAGPDVMDTRVKQMTPEQEEAALRDAARIIEESADSAKAEKAYLTAGAIYAKRRDLSKAKESYQRVIEKFPASEIVQKAQEAIAEINVQMLFVPSATPYSKYYVVQKGDNLTRIAKRFNTTVELIARSNGIEPKALRPGMKLKVPIVKFSIIVDKSQNILTLKADGDIFKTYRVSTGKDNSTPVGTFRIINKIVDPPWYPSGGKMVPSGDPRNVLGSRWMGISKPSYGIHGTIDPGSIGRSVTEGCVRMKNADVEELYALVPEGTEVVIVE